MFNKLVEPSLYNQTVFWVGIFGLLFTTLLGAIFGRREKQDKMSPIYMIKAAFFSMEHLKELKNLDLKFFKKKITSK
jgi:hypothetical protein